MQRELTFYPEIERTRDLLYSEYTSNNRSIHVLLQDNSVPQYRFLLEAYREVVSRYLSTSRIQSAMVFLRELAVRLDELTRKIHITVDDFKTMGFFLLLREPGAYYLLTSRDGDVFVHSRGESLSLSQAPSQAIERLHFDGSTLQEELFPSTLKDCLLLFKLDPKYLRDRDVVLGCGEEDKSTVVEALSDPLWLSGGDGRNSVTSKFITRRILVLRFDDESTAAVGSRALASARRGRVARPWGMALGVSVVLVALIAGAWATRSWLPGSDRTSAPQERSQLADASVETDTEGLTVPGSVEADPDTTRLSENWRKSFENSVTSSPLLHGEAVVFGCRNGKVYALSRETGEVMWAAESSDGVGASPVLQDGSVLIADYAGDVSALNAQTGEILWRRKLPQRVVSSPSVADDRLVVGCYDGYAYCLSLSDGGILWKRKTGAKIRASTAASDGKFFVPSYDGNLYALSVATGEVAWRHRVIGNIASAPIVYNDMVVIGAPDGGIHAVSAEDGSLRWKRQTDAAVKSSPIVYLGRVYVGSNDHHVYCLNAEDGSLVWKYKTEDIVLSRPFAQENVIYVGSYDGYMYCLDAQTGELLDRFQTDGEIYSSPVVDDTSVYFGNNAGSFVCLKHRARKAL